MTNKEPFPLNSEQPDKDLKRILLQYIRYWYLFLIGAVIGLGTAFLYLRYYSISQYIVSSTMLIKDDKNGQGLSSADAFNDLNTFKSTKNIDNEIEVLKSESIMERVVKELDLFTSYYIEGRVIDKEIYGTGVPIRILKNKLDSTAAGQVFVIYLSGNNLFILKDYANSTSHKFGQIIRKPYGSFTVVATSSMSTATGKIIVRFQNIHQLAERYNKAIIVQPASKSSSVLSLSLVDPMPERAKNIINKLIEVYNSEAIEDKNLMAVSTLKFLDERIKFLTTELSGVERGVEKYKSLNGLTDVSTQASGYAAQATSYDQQLSEWAIQIDVLESIEAYLKKTNGQYSMVPSTLGIKDETLVGLIGKFNELQLERERMLRTTQPTSLLIQNINEQLSNLQANILENLQNIKRGLVITSNNLKRTSGQFQSKIRKVPAMERELLEIGRQQSIKQNIYVYLLQKREETALSLAATASNARVLDPARGGESPISPNRQTIYLIAILMGMGIPFAVIYLISLFSNKIKTQQDVTNSLSVPILGEIAHNKQRDILVVTKGNRSPIAEMFQLVRTNLHFATADKSNIVLLVTSSMSGEGKTFFSINIAASLAATGKRVVLVDLDLRESKVAIELGLPEGYGVTDYILSDKIQMSDIIRYSEKIPNLSIISAGPVPSNPIELMMDSKFVHLMHELRESFDYIILDTPPVGLVADAFTLSSFIDVTIYIVRYNHTNKGQLKIIGNIYKGRTLKLPMLVLNDAKEANGGNYGYGYGYGYEAKGKKKKTILQ